MTSRYLLPCRCGRKTPVEPRQAGQAIRCACGAEIEVPTLLGLQSLEREETPPAAAPPRAGTWGLRQAVTLIGLTILVGALAGAVGLLFYRPALPVVAEDRIYDFVHKMPAGETYKQWKALRDEGLDPKDTVIIDHYNEAMFRYRLAWAAVLAAAVAGIAAIIVPLLRARKTDV